MKSFLKYNQFMKSIFLLGVFLVVPLFGQQKDAQAFFKNGPRPLEKIAGQQDRRQGIHSGNQIRTLFYNYGTIGYPYTTPAVEWPKGSNHNYIF